jgi:hypothetical protein
MQTTEKERQDLMYHIFHDRMTLYLRSGHIRRFAVDRTQLIMLTAQVVKGAVFRQQTGITDTARKSNPEGKLPIQENDNERRKGQRLHQRNRARTRRSSLQHGQPAYSTSFLD